MATPNYSPLNQRKAEHPTLLKGAAEETKTRKKDPKDYLYDPKQKGWRGPIVGQTDTLQVTKIIKKQTRELQKQTKDTLLHHRENVQVASPDLDEESDTASRILDLSEAPGEDIPRPFTASFQQAKYATWNAPPKAEQYSTSQDLWEKPLTNREKVGSSIHSTASQLARLEADMGAKDREIDILRTQLLKSQKENYKLIQQLATCSGKNYDELAIDNRVLKLQVEKLVKDNMKLQGQIRREGNSLLKRRETEQYAYAQSETRSRSRSKSPSTVSRSSFKLDVRILPNVTRTNVRTENKRDGRKAGPNTQRSMTYV